MIPTEDEEYMAYCRKALDKAQNKHKTATKYFNSFLKILIGSGIITSILIVLLLLKIFINLPGSVVPAIVVFLILLIMPLGAFIGYREEKNSYEEHITCAEKVNAYTLSYENWLTEIKGKEEARKGRIEESERICAAFQTHPIS